MTRGQWFGLCLLCLAGGAAVGRIVTRYECGQILARDNAVTADVGAQRDSCISKLNDCCAPVTPTVPAAWATAAQTACPCGAEPGTDRCRPLVVVTPTPVLPAMPDSITEDELGS